MEEPAAEWLTERLPEADRDSEAEPEALPVLQAEAAHRLGLLLPDTVPETQAERLEEGQAERVRDWLTEPEGLLH